VAVRHLTEVGCRLEGCSNRLSHLIRALWTGFGRLLQLQGAEIVNVADFVATSAVIKTGGLLRSGRPGLIDIRPHQLGQCFWLADCQATPTGYYALRWRRCAPGHLADKHAACSSSIECGIHSFSSHVAQSPSIVVTRNWVGKVTSSTVCAVI
jgi:hypothetical protein